LRKYLMRNFITLLTAGALIVACADDSRPTQPASRPTAATAEARPDKQSAGGTAKPVDQVGFTKISYAFSGPGTTHVEPGDMVQTTATCPAGTVVGNGGYTVLLWVSSNTPPWVLTDGPNNQNGWTVKFSNEAAGMGPFSFSVWASCLS
jgi:hypothetical protein